MNLIHLRVLAAALLATAISCSSDVSAPSGPVASSISISQTSLSLASLTEAVQLTAAVRDQNGASLSGASVNWTSSDASVASVSSSGVVTAVKNGSATIKAAAGAVSATTTVTVQQIPVSLRLSKDTVKMSSLSDTITLVANMVDAKAQNVSGASVEWSSSNASVATTTATGLVKSVANGTASIRAKSGALSADAVVSILQVPATIVITPRTLSLNNTGDTVRVKATAQDARGNAMSDAPAWSSTNTGVASINAQGLVTARSQGASSIVATLAAVSGSVALRVENVLRLVVKQEVVYEFIDPTHMPDYDYAGVHYPGGPVSYFAQGFTVADLWQDGRPDVFTALNKGYASGIDTRIKPLMFKNVGGTLVEAGSQLNFAPFAGVRRLEMLNRAKDPFKGLFTVAHDTHDGRMADILMVAAGGTPRDMTSLVDPLPLSSSFSRNTAVNAHSMGGGDLNGDGRTDFVVGDWGDWETHKCEVPKCGPYFLIQTADGHWNVRRDSFLDNITFNQPMLTSGAGQGSNLLIDLHLADVNGDGLADLITGYGQGSAHDQVFFNQGDGKFSRSASVNLPPPPYGTDNSMHMRTYDLDLNGDGALDLVIVYSRYVPYYGGYAFQFLINDGKGNFRDETFARLRSIATNEAPNERLSWSDNFQFLDVNGDGKVDLIGSHANAVRVWLNDGAGSFSEIRVDVGDTFGNGAWPLGWADFGSGKIGTLAFRTSWADGAGTATRVWFTHYEFDRVIR